MRTFDAATLAALNERALSARDFIWFTARTRDTGAAVSEGYWSDVGTVSAPVLNPATGLSETRTFYGAGSLIEIDPIPATANLVVKAINVRLSQVADRVQTLLRTYDARQARVEVYRGLFDGTQLVAPAVSRFVGYLDEATIPTAAEGEDAAVVLRCVSTMQEITRSNPDTRSNASQLRRAPNDKFFKDAGTVSQWQMHWGTAKGFIPTRAQERADQEEAAREAARASEGTGQ